MARQKKATAPVKAAVVKTKKNKAVKPAAAVKVRAAKAPAAPRKTDGELMVDNLAVMTQLVKSVAETVEMLVLKTESMAFHIIATEEILAELVADNGLNLNRVNARIRQKLSAGSDNSTDPAKAIDVAASIVSPLPRR